MTWVRRGLAALIASAFVLLLGGSAWAVEGARQEFETVCTGGGYGTNGAASNGAVRGIDSSWTVTCSVTTTVDNVTMRVHTTNRATGASVSLGGTSIYSLGTFVQPQTFAIPTAGTRSMVFSASNCCSTTWLDYYTLDTTAPVSSPSPSPYPVPGPTVYATHYAYPSPPAGGGDVDSCASDTCTVTLAAGTTVGLSDEQALALWLFLGTFLLIALTGFLLRHGRALRV